MIYNKMILITTVASKLLSLGHAEVAAREIRQAGAVQPMLAALLTEEAPATGSPNLAAEAALAVANFATVEVRHASKPLKRQVF